MTAHTVMKTMQWGIYCRTLIRYLSCSKNEQLAKRWFTSLAGKLQVQLFYSTIYMCQKGIGSSEGRDTSLTFDKALVWFLADPIRNAHGCKISVLAQVVWQRQKQGHSRGMCVRLMDCTVGRCVHQRGFLAEDTWVWKWPGRSPGYTYTECCWVDSLAVRSALAIRWLPLRFCEKSETY